MTKKQFLRVSIHVLIWLVYMLIPDLTMDQDFNWFWFLTRNREIPLLALYFYFNVYVLIPRLLARKKLLWFGLSTVACFLLFIFIDPWIDRFAFMHFAPPDLPADRGFMGFRNRFLERGYHVSFRSSIRTISQVFFFFAVSTGWQMYLRWRNDVVQKEKAEKERISAELSLLKMQVSPHFLFNSLNSIYSLTVQQSEKAPVAVVKLSELLRYMIYQAKKDTVLLSEELNYINNFIELQKLRLSEDVTIRYEVNVDVKSREIEPMLLIPIIENTFKHGVSYKEPSEIVILLNDQGGRLHLRTENPVFVRKKSESSGFGLENLKKRLNLRYPDSYSLEITDDGKKFTVDFSINLSE